MEIIGIVGAGTMGAGIAQVAVEHGHEVVLHDVKADRDLRQRGGDDLFVRRDTKNRVDQTLMAEMIGNVGIIVIVQRADPPIHPRPRPWVVGLKRRSIERLIDIGCNCGRFVEHETVMVENRDAVERMQRQMARTAHLRFQIAERERHALLGQHEPNDIHESADRKAVDNDVGHRTLPQRQNGFSASRNASSRDTPMSLRR